MKILVTGAAGMLGSAVCPELESQGHDVAATDTSVRHGGIDFLDVRDLEAVRRAVETCSPHLILHLAAETDVDLCEQQPDHAYLTNTIGTENVALICQQFDIPLVYISTAGVFRGDKPEPYVEFDEPDPVNFYGRTKLEGERAVAHLLRRYFIFRAGWMVGGWEIDKKFVYKIVKLALQGHDLKVVNDKFGSPTFTVDFARNLMPVLETGRYGLYHMTNRGAASRYEIACKVVEFMGLQDKVKVIPVSSAEFPLPAPRARSEMMTNFRLEVLGLDYMPHWQDSLQRYISVHMKRARNKVRAKQDQ